MERYIYIYGERERVKNALFISLMKIYGRFQTVKQLILKHCCWLLLPPLTSSFWGLWMTWYVLTLRFVPECEIFVSVCHYCWNIWCCFQWRVVVYMFIYLQIKTSGTFHMKWKHLRSLLSPKFIFLFIFHRTEFFFFGFTTLYIYLLLKVKYDCLIPVGVAVGPCVHWAAVNDDVFIWWKYTGPEVKQ